uniref:G-protein coupled receptors family 1 profile domain-containing protein n=2 Tax=Latimeria chalumnae TaxID=7897 RepID=H3AS94_LATCH
MLNIVFEQHRMDLTNSSEFSKPEDGTAYGLSDSLEMKIRYVFAAFCGFILIIGVPGHICVFLTLVDSTRSKPSQVTLMTNFLLMNVTVNDLIFLLFNVTILGVAFISRDWRLGAGLCTANQSISNWTMFSSFYSMVTISVVRYIAVVHPTRSLFLRKNQVYPACMLMCMMGFMVSIPNWMYQREVTMDGLKYCIALMTVKQTWLYFVLLGGVGFFPAMFLMFICYSNLIYALWCGRSEVAHTSGHVHMSMRVTVTVLTVLLVFILMWLPYWIMIYISTNGSLPKKPITYIITQISVIFAYSNCAVSPVIYFTLQGGLKKLLKK